MKYSLKNIKKALIIGLDGVPYSLLNYYFKKDYLPNLKKILKDGFSLHPMNASIPDVSSVSWTSFITGVNPGEHGIYGFTELLKDTYSLYFPNAENRAASPFWEILGKTHQKVSTLSQKYDKKINFPYRSIIFNVPQTYPAYPINGILVSGFVAIDLKKAVYPDSIYSYLNSINYIIDIEADNAKEDMNKFINNIFKCFEIRKKAISYFFENKPWDIFFACITETDRLHHFFFDASMNEDHPYHQKFLNFYILLDNWIKLLYEDFQKKFSEKGLFVILSDHGFCSVKKEVYINRFLEEEGFLKLRKEGEFYERIDYETKAFTLDPCRIYIHNKSYPRGQISKEEMSSLISELKNNLNKLKGENGEEVIDKIFEKQEIYQGPYIDMAPDLVCLPKDGYDLKGSLDKKCVFGTNRFAGMHTWHDAFCILPENIGLPEKPSIENISDFIMQFFSKLE